MDLGHESNMLFTCPGLVCELLGSLRRMSFSDILALSLVSIVIVIYLTRKGSSSLENDANVLESCATDEANSQSLLSLVNSSHPSILVLFGSQTGTSEHLAQRFAQDCHSRLGTTCQVADLADHGYDDLSGIPSNCLLVLFLSSYGDGEPTDNAVGFFETISRMRGEGSNSLPSLRYSVFGLGSTKYEFYNAMARNVDKILEDLGATRIGSRGEGDDGKGLIEDEFLTWKVALWPEIAKALALGLETNAEKPTYQPSIQVTECNVAQNAIYRGELSGQQLRKHFIGPFDQHNPFLAPISLSRELFLSGDRNCIHMEFDISESQLQYQTGDHVAVWPSNPNIQVDAFLDIFGLLSKKDKVIDVQAISADTKVSMPSPTTYEAAARYYLDICGPVSRELLSIISEFAPTSEARDKIALLGSDKDLFAKQVSGRLRSLSQVLKEVSNGDKWDQIPFSLLLEKISRLGARYYSISSSSLETPNTVTVTAVVESKHVAEGVSIFKGVATNLLLGVNQKLSSGSGRESDPTSELYQFPSTWLQHGQGVRIPIHIRRSKFRPPSDPSAPIIMIGPGTGVAPFRAFVRERAIQAERGCNVGKTVLYYGCRREDEDYIYADDWKYAHNKLGSHFEIVTAFSRSTSKKVYVQDRLRERAVETNKLLEKNATVYICGDATNMAREVMNAFVTIIQNQRKLSRAESERLLREMRVLNLYQEDIW